MSEEGFKGSPGLPGSQLSSVRQEESCNWFSSHSEDLPTCQALLVFTRKQNKGVPKDLALKLAKLYFTGRGEKKKKKAIRGGVVSNVVGLPQQTLSGFHSNMLVP